MSRAELVTDIKKSLKRRIIDTGVLSGMEETEKKLEAFFNANDLTDEQWQSLDEIMVEMIATRTYLQALMGFYERADRSDSPGDRSVPLVRSDPMDNSGESR